MNKTAILVDGGFYRKRDFKAHGIKSAKERADELIRYCWKHLSWKDEQKHELYRILYYDCLPVDMVVYHPLLKKNIDLSHSETYVSSIEFFEELKKKRKVALRLGEISNLTVGYALKGNVVKALFREEKNIKDVRESDFCFVAKQKGVDMRIGLDIASLAYNRLVDQIVLISGDSDFVPAAKLARREGIDFILDPLYSNVNPYLKEHIDGLRSCDITFKDRYQMSQ